ncbi:MAG: hypothetical protein KC621_19320, partial [Myxococcales bacterium]|nr:hypothetical protein [Myxococcales bacterium]
VELCRDVPALAIDAWLQRAYVRANHGDRAGTHADLAMVEALSSERGEGTTLAAWMSAATILSGVDPSAAEERLRRLEPHLGRLSAERRLRWYGGAIRFAARRGDHDRCRALTEAAVTVAEEEGAPGDLASAYVQRGTTRWFQGDVEGAASDAALAAELSKGGPRWLQLVACNNLAACAMHMLDWEVAHRSLSLAVLRSGGSGVSRRAAEIRLSGLERVMGRGPSGEGEVGGIGDDHWFLWPAQTGDLEGSVALVDQLARSGSRARDAFAQGAAAEVYAAAGRWQDALAAVEIALAASPESSPERPLLVAVQAAALRAMDRRVTEPRALGPSPFIRASAEAWWAAHDALAGDVAAARSALAALEVHLTSPWLTELSELAFRLRVARTLADGP